MVMQENGTKTGCLWTQWLRYRQDGTGEVDASVPSI